MGKAETSSEVSKLGRGSGSAVTRTLFKVSGSTTSALAGAKVRKDRTVVVLTENFLTSNCHLGDAAAIDLGQEVQNTVPASGRRRPDLAPAFHRKGGTAITRRRRGEAGFCWLSSLCIPIRYGKHRRPFDDAIILQSF